MQKTADALPGFGIVAAVMGIVSTMAAIEGASTAEIGHQVAAALVGTFLGILLCYGVFQPVATNIELQELANGRYLRCIKEGVVAALRSDEQRDHLIVGYVVPAATADAGALGTLIEADEDLEFARPRTFRNIEGHRAHRREVADRVVDGDGRIDAHNVARHLGALGIRHGHVDRQLDVARVSAGAEQYAA